MSNEPDLPDEVLRGLAAARLVALDVDGTLTDGRVVYSGGAELQAFCVRDGQGLVWLREAGVELAWISGRGCDATRRRAGELGVRELHLAAGEKCEVLRAVQARLGVGPEATVAMGDDLPDLGLAAGATVFACPGDAHAEVRARADLVTRASGGAGAVRELAEHLLRAKGAWDGLCRRYRT